MSSIESLRAENEILRRALSRRVKVEQRLWNAYYGKEPLPTREECRDLALLLGVPDELREGLCPL